jgi:hypothetical protein
MNAGKLALTLALAALAASPAAALENLTGTWEGRWRCTGLANGAPLNSAEPVTMEVTHDGDGIVLVMNGGMELIYGFVVSDTGRPSAGIITGVSCGTINIDIVGSTSMAHFAVKTKAGDVKASMKGDLLLMGRGAGGYARRCAFTAKRVDATPPLPMACSDEYPGFPD